jgi:uncharacterized protein GlcG (DUF336 family)
VHFKILARPGGLPIVRDGQLIGAIGVEGASAEQDEQLATAAVS